MQTQFKQLELEGWLPAINKAVAVLKHEPDDLEASLSINFTESYDDLDYFKIAILELDNGKQFCLLRYRGNPSGGTEIWVSKDSSNFYNDINEILGSLNLNESDLKWKLDDSGSP